MKHAFVLCFILFSLACAAQTIQDFFAEKEGPVTWPGTECRCG